MAVSNATALIAIDALVIDTETTGLDPAKAWIVEFAGVRLVGGRIEEGATLHRLIRPGIPIPANTTAIHHIDDDKVADAPPFAAIWPDIAKAIGDNVVIGHTLGFDLAVLKRECERASQPFQQPSTLDVRLLAEVVQPNLANFTIEGLAAWLGIQIINRHSAAGDALTTAHIFTALVPKLRESRIRTVGEAIQACRNLTSVLDRQHRAGHLAADAPARSDSEETLRRIDSYPYRHRIRDAMQPPQFIRQGVSAGEALRRLVDQRISSVYVTADPAQQPPSPVDTGIVTERDLVRAIASDGPAALVAPVERFMSKPLEVVPADAFVYRALGRMSRLQVRHLGVVDEDGRVVGALSARDLLRLRAGEAVALGDEIDHGRDAHALAKAWAKLPSVAAGLVAEGVDARTVAAVISREVGALTSQAAVIAERRMRDDGRGDPPCPYALAVLGSAGRGESLLAMDQDNALVFADGDPDGPEDLWFGELGAHVAQVLDAAGVPLCKGGIMARNPDWRGSLATWQSRILGWIGRSRAEDLLSVDIFFDMRPVHGDGTLCTTIWRQAFDAADGQAGFAKLLAEGAGSMPSGLGLFGTFKTSQGRIDLKASGLFGIVTAARALAIRHHVVVRSTPERISGIKSLGLGSARELDALVEAQGVFLELVLKQQLDDIEHGIPPSNRVAIKSLSRPDRDRLRDAFGAVRHIDELTRTLLFQG